MSEPQNLRFQDARHIFQLLGQCQELWDDVDAWRAHLLAGAAKLTGARVAHWVSTGSAAQRGESIASWGWESAAESNAYDAMLGQPMDVLLPGVPQFIGARIAQGFVAFRVNDVLSRSQWQRSRGFNEYLRPANCHVIMMCNRVIAATGALECFGVSRGPGERSFTARDRSLLEHLHRELAPLVGTRLVTEDQLGRRGLSRRQRQTLDALLAGLPQSGAAQRLNLSPTTVHDYVQSLYRHFAVNSRGELMSYFVARTPRPKEPSGGRRQAGSDSD